MVNDGTLSDATVMLQNLGPDKIRVPAPVATLQQQVSAEIICAEKALLIDNDEPESELVTEKDQRTLQQETISAT